MIHVVNEPPDAVDAVLQIKQEVEGEMRWSEPTHCTLQMPELPSSNSPSVVDVKLQPVEDDPALTAGADTQCSMNVKSESDAAISGVSVKPERDGGDDELIVKTELGERCVMDAVN